MFDYDAAACERRAAEPPKRAGAAAGSARRGEFQRDRARVLHSYAFRRLAAKTQVVVPGEDDFPRTRLTHSLEVAQLGRELGAALGCDPDVVDAAGLAHDIGHPPFGHNGETELNRLAADVGGFEANAQTLRVLTLLEPKVIDADGGCAGLNLTRATLDACCKYPWQRRAETPKFGVYADDLPVFEWLRAGAPERRRCLEAQVMDWADDVAYSVHDVEDGVHSGMIRLASLDTTARERLCELAAELYSPHTPAQLAPVLDELLDLPTLSDLAGYDGSYAAEAAAKRATSELTGRFVGAAIEATRDMHGPGPLGRYEANLVVPTPIAVECALLKAIAAHYVMRRPGAEQRLAEQRRLLAELVEMLYEQRGRDSRGEGPDGRPWLRGIIDDVARLTDVAAGAWHERLSGGGWRVFSPLADR